MFQAFMIKHGLLDADTGERLVRFCWCSDGPFDVRDFVVKQCFISKVREYIDLGWFIASCNPHNAGLGSNARVDTRRCSRCSNSSHGLVVHPNRTHQVHAGTACM